MVERRLYDKFLEMFPQYKDHISNYGHSSNGYEVRITTDDHVILLFTYHDPDNWSLETMKSYIGHISLQEKITELKKKIKEDKKNGEKNA